MFRSDDDMGDNLLPVDVGTGRGVHAVVASSHSTFGKLLLHLASNNFILKNGYMQGFRRTVRDGKRLTDKIPQ